jgi:DNA-directed RNA polymerase subunit K/omega
MGETEAKGGGGEERVSYKAKITVGPPRLTDFEKAKIIGIRAIQIQMGAPLFIDPGDERDEIAIAEKELHSGKLPLSIKRSMPNGRSYPPIPVNWLLEAEKEDLQVEV